VEQDWGGGGVQSSRSTSSLRFIFDVITLNTNRFCRRSGTGNSILRSSRPGLRRAGSSVSARFVAMMTCKGEKKIGVVSIREVKGVGDGVRVLKIPSR